MLLVTASSPNLQLKFREKNFPKLPQELGRSAGAAVPSPSWLPQCGANPAPAGAARDEFQKPLQTFLTPHQLPDSWQAHGRHSEIITINISYFGLVISIYSHALSSSKCQGSGFSDIFQKGKGFFFANLSFLICSKLQPALFSETSS